MIGASAMFGEARALEDWQKQISFGRYAFNKSHAVAYSLIALRCLWLKAHFAPEFWAAIMSDCHPEKLIRYMGVARSEGWDSTSITYCGTYDPKVRSKKVQFGTLDINNLQTDFSVTKDHVNQGLTGIKGIGDKAAEIFSGKGNFKSIDEFIEGDGRKSKLVLERFIKLQAFKDLEGHGNSKAVWVYYQYHHCSCVRELKQEVDTKILALEGWNDRTIREERERLVTEYKIAYPKRNKIPVKILKWQPKPVVSLLNINRIITEDFTYGERLEFQKEFIGYYIDDPMRVYDINGQGTIEMAKERARSHKEPYLEALVVSYEVAKSKNDKEFGKLKVTDGLADCTVFIFGRDLGRQDSKCLVPGTGVYVPVEYDIEKKLFRLGQGEMILKLQKI
jgi:DNA polymerase III alpha subunit